MEGRCPLCNEIVGEITSMHLKKKHNMTRQEFIEKYPESKYLMFGIPKKVDVGKPWTDHKVQNTKKWR